MDDPEARQFFLVRDTIKKVQPPAPTCNECHICWTQVCILENVRGLQRVMGTVLDELSKCGNYETHVLEINP